MLTGLGHNALVRGDNKQYKVHANHARNHVVDKLFMARHVYYAHPVSSGQVKPGKAQVYGYAPALFLLPAVGIAAGEGTYEGGLAVVDMARGAYDDVFHVIYAPCGYVTWLLFPFVLSLILKENTGPVNDGERIVTSVCSLLRNDTQIL